MEKEDSKLSKGLIFVLLISSILLVYYSGVVSVKAAEQTPQLGEFEKCSKCHYVRGPHQPLGCTTCHNLLGSNLTLYLEGHPSNLINASPLPIFRVNISEIDNPFELNEFCGGCHQEIFEDYERFAHGNSTFTLKNQEILVIKGYKNVDYILHLAPEYYNLVEINGRACVECHNPHDPVAKPLSILPLQSYRPAPPEQSDILLVGSVVTVIGIVLVALNFVWRGYKI